MIGISYNPTWSWKNINIRSWFSLIGHWQNLFTWSSFLEFMSFMWFSGRKYDVKKKRNKEKKNKQRMKSCRKYNERKSEKSFIANK